MKISGKIRDPSHHHRTTANIQLNSVESKVHHENKNQKLQIYVSCLAANNVKRQQHTGWSLAWLNIERIQFCAQKKI